MHVTFVIGGGIPKVLRGSRQGLRRIGNTACLLVRADDGGWLQGCDHIGSMVAYQALSCVPKAPLLGCQRLFGLGVGYMPVQQHSCMGDGGQWLECMVWWRQQLHAGRMCVSCCGTYC
jgi:hypothetical protein